MLLKLLFSDYKTKSAQNFYLADLCQNSASTTPLKEHTHDFYECFVVLKGEFLEYCNKEMFTLPAGSVHFLTPKTMHGIVGSGAHEHNILRNIAMPESAVNKIIEDKLSNDFRFKLDGVELADFKQKTDYCYTFLQAEAMSEFILKNVVDNLILSYEMKTQAKNIPMWLKNAHDAMMLKENYIIGMKRFVELSCVSHSHLCRSFASAYGCSPTKFIQTQRLHAACEMLRNSDDKISTLAQNCGFENLSFFNRLFVRTYEITPKEYRRLNRAVFG